MLEYWNDASPEHRLTQSGTSLRMELDVQTAALLLLVAAVVAMLTRRLRLPYSVGLVVAGICLAALPFAPKVSLTKDLIFTVLLPPLLLLTGFCIHWRRLQLN